MKPSAGVILHYLSAAYPRFVSVPELQRECRQTDVRKRVSELIKDGYLIHKERDGRYINYRCSREEVIA